MKRSILMLSMMLFLSISFFGQNQSIKNGVLWRDSQNNKMQAHGAGIMQHNGKYYMIGEDKAGSHHFNGINLYSSSDLMNWDFEKTIIDRNSHPTLADNTRFAERAKIIYNESTKNFVVWVHWENDKFEASEAAIFYSDSITGNYTFHKTFRPFGNMSRDCNLFKDDDGTAYFTSAANFNYDMVMYKLTADYLDVADQDTLFVGDHREAPVIVKKDSTYFLITSAATGWDANQAKYTSSSKIFNGEWKKWKNLGNSKTFDTQPTDVIKVEGSNKTTYLYVGDRWGDPSIAESKTIFLPLEIENDSTLTLNYINEFSIDTRTGEWAWQNNNDYISQENWSLVSVTTEETVEGYNPAIFAFDGDSTTFWHTAWGDGAQPFPQELIINLGASYNVSGFTYIPRSDNSSNGITDQFELYLSNDGKTWGDPVAMGILREYRDVYFQEKSAKFVKFVPINDVNEWEIASASEIKLIKNSSYTPSNIDLSYIVDFGNPIQLTDSIITVEAGSSLMLDFGKPEYGSWIWMGANGFKKIYPSDPGKMTIMGSVSTKDAGEYILGYLDDQFNYHYKKYTLKVNNNNLSNVILNKPVTASSNQGGAAELNNGVISSGIWQSEPQDEAVTIEFDLEAYYNIENLTIFTGAWGYYFNPLKDFSFQYLEGDTWKNILTEKGNIEPAYSKKFDPVKANKVRLYITRFKDDFVRLYEIKVFGKKLNDFSAEKLSVNSGDSIKFSAETSTATSWAWTFEGGTPSNSTEETPVVIYNTPGTYDISLIADGDTITKTDYISVIDNKWTKVDDRDPAVTYSNGWAEWNGNPGYNGTETYSETTNASATFSFNGVKARFYGYKRNDLGFASIYVDDVLVDSVDCYAASVLHNEMLYETGTLAEGDHTLKIVVKGEKNPSSSGTEVICDAFEYYTGAPDIPAAGFSANNLNVIEGTSISYKDTSLNNPTSWAWTFEGGTPATSTQQNPTVTYNTTGVYAVYLKATNSAGSDTENKTYYVTVTKSNTNTIISTFPYSESFETGIGDFVQNTDDDYDWTRHTGVTPSDDTGPDQAADGNYYMYSEASDGKNLTEFLLSMPYMNFSNVQYPSLEFKYHMYGENISSLKVQISTDQGQTWVDEWSETGNLGDAWQDANLDLSRYGNTSDILIRFSPTTFGYYGDIAIDDVHVKDNLLDFEADFINVVEGANVKFSDGLYKTLSREWTFEGGLPATSTELNPEVTYSTPGKYDVSLIVHHSNGSDTISKTDYIIANSQNQWVVVDDRDTTAVTYSSGWGQWNDGNNYLGTETYSETKGATVTFKFTGTKARYRGHKRNDLGYANIYIDGVLQDSINLYNSTLIRDTILYESGELAQGEHSLKVEVNGSSDLSSSGFEVICDAFEFYTGQPFTYKPTWESVNAHEAAPEWFLDAKLGIYYHWGLHSVPAYYNEWYSRQLHKNSTVRDYHVENFGDPSEFGYHDFAIGKNDVNGVFQKFEPKLKSEGGNWDPQEWAELFKASGAKYAGGVTEFHDGFSMWDSDVNPWNAMDMGPGLDLTGLIGQSLRNEGLKIVNTFHHAFNYTGWYLENYSTDPTVTSQTENDTLLQAFYGKLPQKQGYANWKQKLIEVVDKYQPDMMWFDFQLDKIPEEYRLDYLSYFFNRSEDQWGKKVVVTYKDYDLNQNVAVKDYERTGLANISETPWLSDDAVSWQSRSYKTDIKYFSTKAIMHGFIDRVSKNGQLLLSVSPQADGTIPQEQKDILNGIGDWMKRYGEAIYATRPWTIYGDGPTNISGNGDATPPNVGTFEDIRFTRNKGNDTLYVFMMDWPETTAYKMKFMGSYNFDTTNLQSVALLDTIAGNSIAINYSQDEFGLTVNLPESRPDTALAYVLRFVFNNAIPDYNKSPGYTQIQADDTRLLEGDTVQFMSNSVKDADSLFWSFEGGTPSTSTKKNPEIIYNTEGVYKVSLIASYANGTDVIVKDSLITIEKSIAWMKVDDRDESITYNGYWGKWDQGAGYKNTEKFSETKKSTATFNFTGTKARYYGYLRNDLGHAYVYVDNVLIDTIDCYSSTLHVDTLLYESEELSMGEHTLQILVSGNKNSLSSGTELICDAFAYYTGGYTNAEFSASETNVKEGTSISFTDSSANNPNSWSWTFNGGTPSSSTTQNPSVVYNTPGTYDVTLTASNNQGADTETKTRYITVTSGIIPGHVYEVQAVHSSKYMEVENSSTSNGANVIQNAYTGNDNQKWLVDTVGSHFTMKAEHSGQSLDVSGGSTANGASIIQWPYSGGNNQKWIISHVSDGEYKIESVLSGRSVCVGGESTANGANIIQWEYNGNDNFHWTFSDFGLKSTPGNSITEEVYEVKVYPNPVSSILYINTGKQNSSYTIFDTHGVVLLQDTKSELDVSGLTPGLYVIKFQSGECFKFMKQ